MLYQLDMRLRELKMKNTVIFGGVAVFLCGDILQLRPVMARYIFEQPKCEKYHVSFYVDALWEKATVISLVNNHRQHGDKIYADLLNRVRTGNPTDDDLNLLTTRVRPHGHPDLDADALVVMCRNKDVNRINNQKLAELESQEHAIDAIVTSHTQKNVNTMTDASGAIIGTQLQKTVRVKIGAKVMMTANVDTIDGLTNGAFGKVIDIEQNKQGKYSCIFVEFCEERIGKELRKKYPELQQRYPGKNVTPVKLFEQEYSLSGKTISGTATATIIQFPLRLAFAATAHKVQGMTIHKPNKLIIDIQARCEPAQAYVMLSRVQELKQLFILESLPVKHLFASPIALQELLRMENISLNKQMNATHF